MKNRSLWLEYDNKKSLKKLNKNIDVDVLIIGGGITGLSVAYHLINSNLKVCLVERNEIGHGITARTTGKITYLQEDIYNKLSKIYSFDVAKKYYESQKDAIKVIKNIVRNNNIECDFTKQISYLFASNNSNIIKAKKEADFLQKMGEKVIENKMPLPINNFYNIGVDNTYYFHPLKYLYTLAEICAKNKINIYENSVVTKIKKINDYYVCNVNKWQINAKKIVIASHYPYFLFPLLFPLKCHLEKSYITASLINKNFNISGINVDNFSKSFRYYNNYLIYLNGSHNLAIKYNNKNNFNNLLEESYKINNKLDYLWSNTDIITNDYLPYIGEIQDNMFIGTGYNTWGMTNGTLAGKIISDLILEKDNNYSNLFNPRRNQSLSGKLNIFKDLYSSAKPFIQNKIVKNKSYYENNVLFKNINGKSVGVYIDENKKEHIVYNICPHLKCSLIFNEVEHTWDCPCHASRFDIDGNYLTGPSKHNISYKN